MPPDQDLKELPLDMIEPNLSQPRRYFDEAALEALAGSVRERGLLQPVLVRPLENGRYGLVAGERRWRAARLAALETIPALVSPYDDLAALEAGLIENMAREDLNPVEEARACATLVKELGLNHGQIADRVGRSRSGVANLVRLLNLSAEILEFLERGELSAGHGRALLRTEDPEERGALARAAIEEGWSVRALEDRADKSNMEVSDAREETALNVARVWGDALGTEVEVRSLPNRRLRVDLVFDSPEGAFAVGGRIGEAVARGAKRR
jgi:ParB family transcriptional regulator, chromosome partitioning protein